MSKLKIYHKFSDVPDAKRVVILGNFDGIHQGHQQLLDLGIRISREKGIRTMVMTFFPQIQSIRSKEFKYLMSQREKMNFLQCYGIDEVLTLEFNTAIASLSPEEFISDVLIDDLEAEDIVIGYNFSFGYKGAGTPDFLQRYLDDGSVHVVDPITLDGEVISSTRIRNSLREGNIGYANELLGYDFPIVGPVIHGNEVGRQIGFPTANVFMEDHLLLPKYGVYSGRVSYEDKPQKAYAAVISIGPRPTVDDDERPTVEAYLLDFTGNLYGETIRVELLHYIRPISKFSSFEELMNAISDDVLYAREHVKI